MSSSRKSGFVRTARVASLVALLLAALTTSRAASTLAPGEKFPALDAALLEGDVPDLKGARVVLVDFWASWCIECKASFPVLESLHREYAGKGLVVVGVNVDQRPKDMERFLLKLGARPGFAIVRDAKQKLVEAASGPTMPMSFLLDGKGVVRFVHSGFFGEKTRKEYIDEINAILAEAP